MVAPIFFNLPEPTTELFSNGKVLTCRAKRKTVGRTRAVRGSLFKQTKLADVIVRFVRDVEKKEDLKRYRRFSGYITLDQWWHHIQELSKGKTLALYSVWLDSW